MKQECEQLTFFSSLPEHACPALHVWESPGSSSGNYAPSQEQMWILDTPDSGSKKNKNQMQEKRFI